MDPLPPGDAKLCLWHRPEKSAVQRIVGTAWPGIFCLTDVTPAGLVLAEKTTNVFVWFPADCVFAMGGINALRLRWCQRNRQLLYRPHYAHSIAQSYCQSNYQFRIRFHQDNGRQRSGAVPAGDKKARIPQVCILFASKSSQPFQLTRK